MNYTPKIALPSFIGLNSVYLPKSKMKKDSVCLSSKFEKCWQNHDREGAS